MGSEMCIRDRPMTDAPVDRPTPRVRRGQPPQREPRNLPMPFPRRPVTRSMGHQEAGRDPPAPQVVRNRPLQSPHNQLRRPTPESVRAARRLPPSRAPDGPLPPEPRSHRRRHHSAEVPRFPDLGGGDDDATITDDHLGGAGPAPTTASPEHAPNRCSAAQHFQDNRPVAPQATVPWDEQPLPAQRRQIDTASDERPLSRASNIIDTVPDRFREDSEVVPRVPPPRRGTNRASSGVRTRSAHLD